MKLIIHTHIYTHTLTHTYDQVKIKASNTLRFLGEGKHEV